MHRKDRTLFWALFSPVLLTLGAAILHKYPFAPRLVLFLLPAGVILVAEGFVLILNRVKRHQPVVMAVCVVAVMLNPLWRAVHRSVIT